MFGIRSTYHLVTRSISNFFKILIFQNGDGMLDLDEILKEADKIGLPSKQIEKIIPEQYQTKAKIDKK